MQKLALTMLAVSVTVFVAVGLFTVLFLAFLPVALYLKSH